MCAFDFCIVFDINFFLVSLFLGVDGGGATRSSNATSRSRSCRRVRATPIAWRASSAKRDCSRRSIIRTSAHLRLRRCRRRAGAGARAGRGRDAGRSRLAAGPLPLDEALAIARQIADALEPRTRRASSIAISNPPTSRSRPTASSRCSTSVWRRLRGRGVRRRIVDAVADDRATTGRRGVISAPPPT